MKAMVEGVWRTDVEPTPAYRAAAERSRFRGLGARGWRLGLRARAGALSPLRLLCLPLCASDPSRARAAGSGGGGVGVGARPRLGRTHGLGVRHAARGHAGSRERPRIPARGVPQGECALHRQGHRAGALGQKARRRSSTTNRPRSCACSRSSSARSPPPGSICTPSALRAEIDEVNALVGPRVNNGVYRAGFASTQEAYDAAVRDLFAALDDLEARLATRRFLIGERLTEADLRLFPTLIRFDVAYYGALRCNLKRLADYPHLLAYTKRILRIPGVAATVKLDHVKRHYWDDHEMINRRIVPIGPTVEFEEQTAARAA